ncbi:hydroxyacylglutathione hydrolase [Stutzerimonas tarimensis]|uniref:Hydroxyacylglutathione hydrolase n=1 Tax=Stutzerimonas tarimensis TaxID=1507735 RepID=A0ABV7T3E5_9GAMM
MLRIEPLRAFSDNYIWLIQDEGSRQCAAVDPGDAAPVMAWLEAHHEWTLSDILITHHHADHVGGVPLLKAATGARVAGPAGEEIPERDLALSDGQTLSVLGRSLQAIEVPGHTAGHIAYFCGEEHPWLLSGDTLFAAGCGRLFEGTAAQMHRSLQRLAALPAETLVYCTHEYTQSNLRFAQAVEPGNPEIAARCRQVDELRADDQVTLPSHLALEFRTNPFLRVDQPDVRAAAAAQGLLADQSSPEAVFAAIRAWKDRFQ